MIDKIENYLGKNVLIQKIGCPEYDKKLYDSHILLLYEAQKWLREEKNVIIVVCPYTYNIVDETHTWTYELWFGDNFEIKIHDFNFYEEALLEGIKEAIKILKMEE